MTAQSVGIIGGADGPTAIFIIGSLPVWQILGAAAAILILGILAYKKKGRNHHDHPEK